MRSRGSPGRAWIPTTRRRSRGSSRRASRKAAARRGRLPRSRPAVQGRSLRSGEKLRSTPRRERRHRARLLQRGCAQLQLHRAVGASRKKRRLRRRRRRRRRLALVGGDKSARSRDETGEGRSSSTSTSPRTCTKPSNRSDRCSSAFSSRRSRGCWNRWATVLPRVVTRRALDPPRAYSARVPSAHRTRALRRPRVVAQARASLPTSAKDALVRCVRACYTRERFTRTLAVVQQIVTVRVFDARRALGLRTLRWNTRRRFFESVVARERGCRSAGGAERGADERPYAFVPLADFRVDAVNGEGFDASEDYSRWRAGPPVHAFCDFPFVYHQVAEGQGYCSWNRRCYRRTCSSTTPWARRSIAPTRAPCPTWRVRT